MGEGYAGLSDSPSRDLAPQMHRGERGDARVATVISYWSPSRPILSVPSRPRAAAVYIHIHGESDRVAGSTDPPYIYELDYEGRAN